MPDITITVDAEWAQRFLAASDFSLMTEYMEAHDDVPPANDTVFGQWCLKRLGRKFILRQEEEMHRLNYNPSPLEAPK